jgi:DNA-directed RNA polymerase subunit M/transcription elongation factor TFIIS
MKFPCPKCDQSLEISEDFLGTDFPCPSCGHSMHVEPTSEKSRESDEKMTDFSCVHCEEVIRTSSTLADTEIDCPHCGERTGLYFDKEDGEDYDPYEKEETSSSHDEVKKPASKKKEKRDVPNHAFGHRQIISLVGCMFLVVGVFAPIAKFPALGSINYFAADGLFVFCFAIIALIAMLVRKEGLQLVMGLISLGFLSFSLSGYFTAKRNLNSENTSDVAQILSNFLTLDWGWGLLIAGCALIITPTFIKAKPSDTGEEFFVLSKPWRVSTVSISGIYGLLIMGSIFFGLLDFVAPNFEYLGRATLSDNAAKQYSYSKNTDPIDDTITRMLTISPKGEKNGIFTNTSTLIIRHSENNSPEFDVYFNLGSLKHVDFKNYSNRVNVTIRIDKEKSRTLRWVMSTDRRAVFYDDKRVSFIARLLNAKQLVLRVSRDSETDVTAIFDLNGMGEAIKPMNKFIVE